MEAWLNDSVLNSATRLNGCTLFQANKGALLCCKACEAGLWLLYLHQHLMVQRICSSFRSVLSLFHHYVDLWIRGNKETWFIQTSLAPWSHLSYAYKGLQTAHEALHTCRWQDSHLEPALHSRTALKTYTSMSSEKKKMTETTSTWRNISISIICYISKCTGDVTATKLSPHSIGSFQLTIGLHYYFIFTLGHSVHIVIYVIMPFASHKQSKTELQLYTCHWTELISLVWTLQTHNLEIGSSLSSIPQLPLYRWTELLVLITWDPHQICLVSL